jgi:hypothetical protein
MTISNGMMSKLRSVTALAFMDEDVGQTMTNYGFANGDLISKADRSEKKKKAATIAGASAAGLGAAVKGATTTVSLEDPASVKASQNIHREIAAGRDPYVRDVFQTRVGEGARHDNERNVYNMARKYAQNKTGERKLEPVLADHIPLLESDNKGLNVANGNHRVRGRHIADLKGEDRVPVKLQRSGFKAPSRTILRWQKKKFMADVSSVRDPKNPQNKKQTLEDLRVLGPDRPEVQGKKPGTVKPWVKERVLGLGSAANQSAETIANQVKLESRIRRAPLALLSTGAGTMAYANRDRIIPKRKPVDKPSNI